MQKYVDHLLSDIQQAGINKPVKQNLVVPKELEDNKEVIEYLNLAPRPMEQLFGIEKISFPPISKLSVKQVKQITEAIIKLWSIYNFIPDFPKGLPVEKKYKLLIDFFSEPVSYISKGTSHVEFCDYNTKNCPYPEEFCMCKDLTLRTNVEF